MGWNLPWSKRLKDASDKKRKLDQNEVPVKIAGGIGQARLSRLNTGEKYRLTISNHLNAKIIGGQVGSIKVTGETVIIQDLNNKVVFSGEQGDLITVKDDNGVSTAVAEVGAGSRTDSFVDIAKAVMLETNYKLPRGMPQVVVENLTVQRTQSVRIEQPARMDLLAQPEIPIQTDIPGQMEIPIQQMEMEMNANKMAQNMSPAAVPTGMPFNNNGNELWLARDANNDTASVPASHNESQELLQSGSMDQEALENHAQFLRIYNQLTALDMAEEQRQEPQLGQEENTDDIYE